MMYNGYAFWGMDLVWWIIWILLMFWIFILPYNIPGQRSNLDSPIYILKRKFAEGQITIDEYNEKKKILDKI